MIPLISTVPTSGEVADVDAYLQRQHERLTTGAGYSFVITDSRTHQAVGQIGLWTQEIANGRASTGYWIAPHFRRRGYAAAALHTLTEWAVTLDAVRRLHLFVEPWNEGHGEQPRHAAINAKACCAPGSKSAKTAKICTPTASYLGRMQRTDMAADRQAKALEERRGQSGKEGRRGQR